MLLLPAAATAAEAPVPPGNSAVDQYTETYPTASGDQDTRGGSDDRTAEKILGRRQAGRLEVQGSNGEAVTALAAATAPARERGADAGSGGEGGSPTGSPGPSGSAGIREIAAGALGLTPGGGPGLLALALLGTALWAAFYLLRRNRSQPR